MSLETEGRAIPFTHSRAATELVQGRRHLSCARESLELALAIESHLGSTTTAVPVPDIEEVLGILEEAEAALRRITAMAR